MDGKPVTSGFMLYGANGYCGEAIARLAVEKGLRPVLAGRNAQALEKLASELGLEWRAFDLQDSHNLDNALKGMVVVLSCAGPFMYTYRPLVDACLRNHVHYLDLTGEIPVYEAIAARDAEARQAGVMLMPGAGFDVVPSDCLALHLKQILPSATHLALAFKTSGPAGLPPGTQRTSLELIQLGTLVRRNGRLEPEGPEGKNRQVDFGRGLRPVSRFLWGDVFTAYYSTGIPNIEVFTRLPWPMRKLVGAVGLLKMAPVRSFLKLWITPGASPADRARSSTHLWGEVTDDQGRRAAARLHGPEAGVEWTARAALAAVGKVLNNQAPIGYQTPARAYGADFVLEVEGVTREDID